MKRSLRGVLLLAALHLLAVGVEAQDLREMEFENLASTGLVVDDPEAAVLVVETTVTPLSFDSRGGILRVREHEPGVYQVLLKPAVHYVEIRAEGYLVLKLPRWNFEPRSGRKIRVRARPRFGAEGGFDVNRPELRLEFAAGGQEVYVQLDANPPQKLDFSRGYVALRPTPGTHTVKVFAGGRAWQQTVELEAGQRYQEAVSMAEAAGSTFTASHPGNLFIESNPPGATVYLNQVEQSGVTPVSLTDLQPGTYRIEVVLAQHLAATQQGVVRELEYTTVHVDLTPNYGQVSIGSSPAGALVYLSDEQRGTTPFSARLDAGVYPLRLVRSLYHDAHDTLRIEPGTQLDRTYPLRPAFGTVAVTSEPAGARVVVAGVSWGVTPLRREQVLSARHVVQVELDPYPPQ
ncbi:MAG: PEGA domain-containing protein, partial [Planctomycetes bacterium]|nr:PEGA domain-containing protein [Planctomycetota bacterium]